MKRRPIGTKTRGPKWKAFWNQKEPKSLCQVMRRATMGSFPIPTPGRVTLGDRLKTAWMRNTLKFVLPGVEDSFKRERGGQWRSRRSPTWVKNFPGSWSDSKNLICFEVLKFGRSFNFFGGLGGVICRFIFPI